MLCNSPIKRKRKTVLLSCAVLCIDAGGDSAEAEKNVFVRCSIFVLIVLSAVMPATARPTWSSEELFYSSSAVAAGTEQCSLAYYLSSANNPEISQLAKIYPTTMDVPASEPASVSAMLLPATPASGLLTLVGFVCISLIRDRRIWLAGFAGLSLFGQTGTQAVASSSRDEDSQAGGNLFRSYPKGLTLPNTAGVFAFSQKDIPRVNFTHTVFRTAAGSDYHWSYSAVLNLVLRPDSNALCLVSGTRQFACFSPALIFCRMPRGPPMSQMRLFCITSGV
jgi:hypothetical protein